MNSQSPRRYCIRCGACCLKSSPTLQWEDLPLIQTGRIQKKTLFTIRRGELVHDIIVGEIRRAPEEMVKIRERDSGGCIFYDAGGKACTIYEHRPIQCAALKCWDTAEFMEVYQGPKLQRKDLLEDEVLLGLIAKHEERCSYARLEEYVEQIETQGEGSIEKILDALKLDYYVRPFTSERLGLSRDEMDKRENGCAGY
ncbi:MAG: YkgJ family cysteine cluster protein [Deltaproteobacteria bacterium]